MAASEFLKHHYGAQPRILDHRHHLLVEKAGQQIRSRTTARLDLLRRQS